MSPEPSRAPRTIDTLPQAAEDYTLDYAGSNGILAHCRIRTYVGPQGKVIVATELDDNPGASVTNAAEFVHLKAWTYAGRPGEVAFVEHYPRVRASLPDEPRGIDTEGLDLVSFPRDPLGDLVVQEVRQGLSGWAQRFGEPRWRSLPLAEFLTLIEGHEPSVGAQTPGTLGASAQSPQGTLSKRGSANSRTVLTTSPRVSAPVPALP